jgi:hypothetical protein
MMLVSVSDLAGYANKLTPRLAIDPVTPLIFGGFALARA